MACYHPIQVMVKKKGRLAVRRPVTVGCGRCIGCRAEQSRQWAVRLLHEKTMHDAAWFLTLTYSEEEIPQYGSLYPTDLQRFFKNLRRDYQAGSVRYYACGEYGEVTQRPHYHAVLYGPHFLDKHFLRSADGLDVWRSQTLEDYWPHGHSEFGTLTSASAAYVAGYVRKKVSKRVNEDAYLRVDDETGELVELEPEFARMSLRPAIGRTWLEKYWQDVYPRDAVVVNGREFKPPRYYDRVMSEPCKPDVPCFAGGCDVHQEIMMEVSQKRIDEAEAQSAYTLEAGEKIHQARIGLFQSRGKI